MSFAAILLGMTNHMAPMQPGPGQINVLIEGQPAWCAVNDKHVCPVIESSKPHVGGIVRPTDASKTVLINGLPAARVGDIITEVGSFSTITIGAKTVIIG